MDILFVVISAVAGALATLAGLLIAWPKLKAEARRLNAEASKLEWQTLHDEIKRLDLQTAALRIEITNIQTAGKAREGELDRENGRLRGMVRKLEGRVSDLESILKIGPLPPDMKAALDELDRKTGRSP